MGYSLTIASVERVKRFLDELVLSQADVTWKTNEPKFSYYIREGIKASKWLITEASLKNLTPAPELFNYANLDQKYKIRIRPGLVVAELRSGGSGDTLAIQDIITVIDNVETLYQIVGAIVDHKASKMQFPNAKLLNEDIVKLKIFAETKSYNLDNLNPLTVSKK